MLRAVYAVRLRFLCFFRLLFRIRFLVLVLEHLRWTFNAGWTFDSVRALALHRRGFLFADIASRGISVEFLRDNFFISESEIYRMVTSSALGVILVQSFWRTVAIELLFKPLHKFHVFLDLGLGHPLDIYFLMSACFIQCSLHYFHICYELVIIFCFPVDSAHGDAVWIYQI